ncbi:ABC transporter permease [Actinophytocola sp. NPDC049390]|uniref:ABC transporter permease n=1 Tax=Actinophytocola sp. NPDC049390 TaxID=3363894 RepID=UPI0037A4F23E
MVWLTWRQHRAQILVTAGFLVVVGAVLLVHGLAASGLPDDARGARYDELSLYVSWLPVVPLGVGMFWGAPLLARELERGTHRLAWTQSVSRPRWLAVKLGVLGLAVTGAGLALGGMVSAWLSVFESTGLADRFGDTEFFGATGVLGGVWWLFAFALGTAAGGVLRRTLPAFAVTIAVFVLAMMGLFAVRQDYAEPARIVVEGADTLPTSFITGSAYLSPAGVESEVVPECAAVDGEAYLSCIRDSDYRTVLFYHPTDRYWQFQWTETGILVVASLLLAGPVVYRVARRPV